MISFGQFKDVVTMVDLLSGVVANVGLDAVFVTLMMNGNGRSEGSSARKKISYSTLRQVILSIGWKQSLR